MKIEQQYMTVKELSRMINIKPATVYDWVHKGKIPYSKLGSKNLRDKGSLRFKISEIKTWLKKMEYMPKPGVDGL